MTDTKYKHDPEIAKQNSENYKKQYQESTKFTSPFTHYIFITLRLQVNDISHFESFVNSKLIPYITSLPVYFYTIEKDNSPDRHLHAIFKNQEKDKYALTRKLTNWLKKHLKEVVHDSDTAVAFDIQSLKPDDVKIKIGYIYKEDDLLRSDSSHVDDIQSCKDLYTAQLKPKKSIITYDREMKNVLSKTIFSYTYDYFRKTEKEFTPNNIDEIYYYMIQDGYSFINCSKYVKSQCLVELKIALSHDGLFPSLEDDDDERYELINQVNQDKDIDNIYQTRHKKLCQWIESQGIDIPNHIIFN